MRGPTHLTVGILTAIETSILTQNPLNPVSFIFVLICSLLPDIDTSNSTISNTLIKSSFSKLIYRYSLYIINIVTFIILIYINKNLVFNFILSFILIIIIEKKLNHAILRKSLFSLLSIILSLSLYYIKAPFSFIFISVFLGIAPWLKHRGFTHSSFAVVMIYFLLKEIESIVHYEYIAFYGTLAYASHLFLGDIFTKMGIPIFYPIYHKKISFGFIKVNSFVGNLFEFLYIILYIIIIIYTLKIKSYF